MNQYAVYVQDDAGWRRDCPSSEDVFFGGHEGTFYRHPSDLPEDIDIRTVPLGFCGFVVVEGQRAAVALRNRLNQSGDWGDDRPTYAVSKLTHR